MDPVSLIESALMAGVTIEAKDTADQAVEDAYISFKTLLNHCFVENPHAQVMIDEYKANPEAYEQPLKKLLTEAHVEQKREILEAAQRVMNQVQSQQAATGKYNVQIAGNVQGFAQGDHQRVTMHFDNPPKEHE